MRKLSAITQPILEPGTSRNEPAAGEERAARVVAESLLPVLWPRLTGQTSPKQPCHEPSDLSAGPSADIQSVPAIQPMPGYRPNLQRGNKRPGRAHEYLEIPDAGLQGEVRGA